MRKNSTRRPPRVDGTESVCAREGVHGVGRVARDGCREDPSAYPPAGFVAGARVFAAWAHVHFRARNER